jgi:hypothetical protein
MTYDSPTTVNMTSGIGNLFYYLNSVTDQWISNMIMLAIYIIILMGYYKAKDDFQGALAVSGYVTFIVGLLFWIGEFINGWTFGIIIAVAIIGTIVLLLDN